MSRDILRHSSISEPKHLNGQDNLSLNLTPTINQVNSPSQGMFRRNYGANDDGSSILIQRDTIASSPYKNASSAIANLVQGCVPDRQHIQMLSIVERQPAVGYTKTLELPVHFLPGEDEIKLREDLTYHIHKRKTIYRGELIVTKYRLLFVTKAPDALQILIDVPLGMISQIEKKGGQTRSSISEGAVYGIEINCKDLRYYFFGSAKEQNQRRNLFENLTRLVFPLSIQKTDLISPLSFFSSFFAWNYKREHCPDNTDDGWSFYNKIKEYKRMGIQLNNDSNWSINTDINKNYEFCETYPDIIVVPAKFDVTRLPNVATFRSRNRIPVLSWYSQKTLATITRSSQPLTGLGRKSQDDVDYLNAILNTNTYRNPRLFIIDARPKVNAIANKANGGGYEDYSDCELEFQNIENIHVMRESLHKLQMAMRNAEQDDKVLQNEVENCNWLSHIRMILISAQRLATLVHDDKRSVLVHCSDGWDRTAQLTSLAMMMLDDYYRTLKGFIILIEKEWISFGHKFLLRIGHGDTNDSERSPVFLQFLDCTYQLMQQFQSEFEFNETFLITIADYLYSCQFGTFLLNSEKIRKDMKITQYTMSVWTSILSDRTSYLNPLYVHNPESIIQMNMSVNQMKLWKNYYYRYMFDYQSSLDNAQDRLNSND